MNRAVVRDDWAGRVIDGRFTLLRWLGAGQSSNVFLTEHTLTEQAKARPQKAAIKFIPADAVDAEAFVAAWVGAKTLSHPHLMPLLYTGRCRIDDTDLLITVTEYAEENLAEILPVRPLTPTETGEMLNPVLDALAYLHGRGFVHGHLKPSNILVVGDQLKLSVDRLYFSGKVWKHSLPPGVYDAPETATQMSPAADMWSLGITLVEALTQNPPRWDKSTAADPVVPESIPQPFARIARETLRREPARRCTLDQVRGRLDPAGTLPALPALAARVDKLKPARIPLAAIIAAVVALLALIVVLLGRTHKAPPSTDPATHTSTSAVPGSQTSADSPAAKDAVVERVMPSVPAKVSDTIRGTIDVGVRVTVKPNGDVSNATLESRGPSRYFAELALQASRRWKFRPVQVNGRAVSSIWILRFRFSQSGTEVTPVQTSP
jgi:TonB family protein